MPTYFYEVTVDVPGGRDKLEVKLQNRLVRLTSTDGTIYKSRKVQRTFDGKLNVDFYIKATTGTKWSIDVTNTDSKNKVYSNSGKTKMRKSRDNKDVNPT